MEQFFGLESTRGYLIKMCKTREAAILTAQALLAPLNYRGRWSDFYKIVPYEREMA